MQMNVTSPAFTARTAYGNEYKKTNAGKWAGAATGAAVLGATYVFTNKGEKSAVKFVKDGLVAGWEALKSAKKSFVETFKKINLESTKKFVKDIPGKVAEGTTSAYTSAKDTIKNFKFKEAMKKMGESIKNIDVKKLGTKAGKVAVYALPVIALVTLGAIVDKAVNRNRAEAADNA